MCRGCREVVKTGWQVVHPYIYIYIYIYICVCLKVKVNFILEQATKAKRRSRGIALLVPLPRRYSEVDVQRHAPAALPPAKTRYAL